jgi:hypothetical protein
MIIFQTLTFLTFGLKKAGHPWQEKKDSINKATKLDYERFRAAYGIGPMACKNVFEDLQRHDIIRKPTLERFFMALSWLKNYPNENNNAGNWGLCENIVWKHTWD